MTLETTTHSVTAATRRGSGHMLDNILSTPAV